MSETSVLNRPTSASRRRSSQRRLEFPAPEPIAEAPGVVTEGPPRVRYRRPGRLPTTPTEPRPERVSPPPVFHPLAYRGVLATWSLEARERWGRRANEWEDHGLSWRDAEARAFVEVWNELRRGGDGFADPDRAAIRG